MIIEPLGNWRPKALRLRGQRLASCDSGVAAVEFAMIIPVLLVALLLTIEFGRLTYSKVEFEYALFNATRYGMVQKAADTAKIKQAISDNLMLLKPANLKNVTVTEVANPDKTRTATITASYDVKLLVPFSDMKSITLSRTMTFLRAQ